MTKIAIPIRPMIVDEGLSLMANAKDAGADFVELWCDKLKSADAKTLVKMATLPVILNLKGRFEGGEFRGTFNERMKYLVEVAMDKAEYIDIPFEDAITHEDIDSVKDRLIFSYHNFEMTPPLPELEDIFGKMAQLEPKVIKLATMVNKEIDLINLFKLQINFSLYRDKRVVIGMGEKGRISRVLAPMFKNVFTFASLSDKYKTAPGQLTILELKNEWKKLLPGS